MKKSHLIGLFALVMLVAGCTKDEEARVVGNSATSGTKVDMTTEQERRARKMVRRMPKLRYWDETNNRFIDFNPTTRDFEFTDPDEGFVFDDPDG